VYIVFETEQPDMAVTLAQHLLTVEDYHKMGEVGILPEGKRVELIAGKIINMSPIGSSHAACVDNILALFNRIAPEDRLIRGQNPIILDNHSEPEPDVAVLRYRADRYASGHPKAEEVLFVLEVSGSFLAYDEEVKLPLYAAAGIPAYCMVNLKDNTIALHTIPEGEHYKKRELFAAEDRLPLTALRTEVKVGDMLV
jgi:Uma2 family endonuclease